MVLEPRRTGQIDETQAGARRHRDHMTRVADATAETTSQPGQDHAAASSGGSVRLSSVEKRYGDFVALSDFDLEIRAGEFLSVLGPSGSGKTTTLRIIGGFVRPDAGRVELSGQDVTHLPANKRDVNTVFQSYALFPHMSVEANVGYGLKVRRVPRAERTARVKEALRLVQLEDFVRRRPSQLSGGMQQRVALARAIANRPRVLLLDEPLGALDRKLREDMQIELRQLQATLGLTFVYVTHDQEEALAMSDRVVVMRDGRIQQIGTPTAVYDDPVSLWVAGFVGASNRLPGVVRSRGERLEIDTDVTRIVAARFDPGLAERDAAVAVVRPEDIVVHADEPDRPTNRVAVEVSETLPVGGQVRCIAHTAGGLQLIAHRPRSIALDQPIDPGSHAYFTWEPEAVRAYTPEPKSTGAPASAAEVGP
jgi:spermidine/putrescine transport system ATP-binding protein